jgi:hypothetical protein
MASLARIFLTRAGTTIAILALGLGGGHLIGPSIFGGTSAQNQAAPSHKQASSEPLPAVRVVYPNSAEPAQQVIAAAVPTESAPPTSPQLETQSAVPLTTPNVATPVVSRSKTRRQLRAERRQHYAARRAPLHQHQLVLADQREPEIMAFDGDTAPPRTGFFGN